MSSSIRVACFAALALRAACASAAADTTLVVPVAPSVAVTGAATASFPNDRMQATLRVESENANPATAASDANARMTRALAKVKSVAGVEAKSAGYSTWQTWDKGRPSKWKVVQSVALTGTDFTAIAGIVSRLQDEDGMLVTNLAFSVSPESRRRAEDALMREAIRSWQQRAATAADALGFASWRAGRLNVATGDAAPIARPEMMMRAQAAPAAAGVPVAVEGGTTEITVTVTGDAMLEGLRGR